MQNLVILTGRLTRDPEMADAGSGKVCKFGLATSEYGKDKKEYTTFHNITVWGVQGENCEKYLSKGNLVNLEGSIRNSKYTQDGVEKHWSEVVARRVNFLTPKGEGGSSSGADTSFDVDDFADV